MKIFLTGTPVILYYKNTEYDSIDLGKKRRVRSMLFSHLCAYL